MVRTPKPRRSASLNSGDAKDGACRTERDCTQMPWCRINDACQRALSRDMGIPLPKQKPLRVWWIPQIPGKPFRVDVPTLAEGVKLMDVLAQYDIFQYEHRIKPDYCNAGGIEMLDTDGEWCDWYDEETGEDDPRVFLNGRHDSNDDHS